MKEKVKSISIKNIIVVFCLVFVAITIINTIEVKKLRSEISSLKENSFNNNNKDLSNKTINNFFELEKGIDRFFDFISKEFVLKQEQIKQESDKFTKEENKRLINVYNKNEEEFFNEFEKVTGIERIK